MSPAAFDAHSDTHDAAALDERGRRLGSRSFTTDTAGQWALLAWREQFGELSVIGAESTGSYAAGACALTRSRSSKSTGRTPMRAPAGQERPDRRRDGDPPGGWPGDATDVPKLTTGIVESIRQRRVARDSAVKARSAALCQLTGLIVTAPDERRDQLSQRKTTRGKATLCSRLRPRTNQFADPTRRGRQGFALR